MSTELPPSHESLLPSQMTVAELRDYLDVAGVSYSKRDRKDALVFAALKVRYGS